MILKPPSHFDQIELWKMKAAERSHSDNWVWRGQMASFLLFLFARAEHDLRAGWLKRAGWLHGGLKTDEERHIFWKLMLIIAIVGHDKPQCWGSQQ
jgi:hypothetical protein